MSDIEVDLVTLADSAGTLLANGPVPPITLLPFQNDVGEGSARAAVELVAACPHLVEVRELECRFDGLGMLDDVRGEMLACLLHSPYLTRLETLIIEDNSRAEGVFAVAEAHQRLPALRRLRFASADIASGTDVGDEGAIALAAASFTPQLEVFEVEGGGVAAKGIRALAKRFRKIRRLSLPAVWYMNNPIEAKGARALAAAKGLSNLSYLHLGGGDIGDEGAIALASASWLASVTELDLSDNNLTETGLLALARSPHLHSLEQLHLYSGVSAFKQPNKVTPTALHAFEALPHLHAVSVVAGEWLEWPPP